MSSSLDKLIHRLLQNFDKDDWLDGMSKSDRALLVSCLNDKRHNKTLRKRIPKTVLTKLKSKLSPQKMPYKKKRSTKSKKKDKRPVQTKEEDVSNTTDINEDPKHKKNKAKSLPASLIAAMNKLHINKTE